MLVLLALCGCDAVQPRVDDPRQESVRVPPPPLDSLRAAPETISIADVRIAASAVLWLDFMPGYPMGEPSGPPAAPLRGRISIHRADSLDARPFPSGLALQGGWLIGGDSIWPLAVVPSDTTRDTRPGLALGVWGGPAWLQPEDRVDVVLRVRRPRGAPVLLRVRGVAAERVE